MKDEDDTISENGLESRYLDVDPGFSRGVGKTPFSRQDESCAPKYHHELSNPSLLMS